MDRYRSAVVDLAGKLSFRGRLLLGASLSEGLNGTFSGSQEALCTYCASMHHENLPKFADVLDVIKRNRSSEEYESLNQAILQEFYSSAVVPYFKAVSSLPFTVTIPFVEFKWSLNTTSPRSEVFPDLYVKVVSEIVSTGGRLSSIPIKQTSQNYLTPEEFDAAVKHYNAAAPDDTVLIDCRNSKEVAIGKFRSALDPKTKTFTEFPTWVDKSLEAGGALAGKKKVLMYCTGGIRCEKASAYIRNQKPDLEVYHLKGGIHRYLEKYEDKGEFLGKNFVFDSRQGMAPAESAETVGQCVYCKGPYDNFTPNHVCTVCREQILVCPKCKGMLKELHCDEHQYLKNCYFHNLSLFPDNELTSHRSELSSLLEQIAIGKAFRMKRKTLSKQISKIDAFLAAPNRVDGVMVCRSCQEPVDKCGGECWGYFGLSRKTKADSLMSPITPPAKKPKQPQPPPQTKKRDQRLVAVNEIKELNLSKPLSACLSSNMRCIPPVVRTISTNTKAKWIGRKVREVVLQEFVACKDDDWRQILVNGSPITTDSILHHGDVVARRVHWHEPPIFSECETLDISLPRPNLFAINKPSTVPTHPAGQYLANSLTMMAEAQLGLPIKSLHPCHRLDKCTSGLVVCSNDPKMSKLVQQAMDTGCVEKTYLAKVSGKFSDTSVTVNEPIFCQDPQQGIRVIDSRGKSALSEFKLVAYNAEANESLLCCLPKTGRGHQLRVHLQHLGFPIVGDVLYGGKAVSTVPLKQVLERMRMAVGVDAGDIPCECCSTGFEAAFKRSQLLQEGSSICLHALEMKLSLRGVEEPLILTTHKPAWSEEFNLV